MTKNDIMKDTAEKTGVPRKTVELIYEHICGMVAGDLRRNKTATLPDIAKLIIRMRPARKAGKIMVGGKEYSVEARPAKQLVKARILKVFEERV